MKEQESWWIFTFGSGQKYNGHYVKIFGTFNSARNEMFKRYGKAWAFQYSQEEWDRWVEECKRNGAERWLETELVAP